MGAIKKSDGKSITLTDSTGKILDNVSLQGKETPTPSSATTAMAGSGKKDELIDYAAIAEKVNQASAPRYTCGNPSSFGCGSYNCVSCYPFTYRCPEGHEYRAPVPNGEPMPDCPNDDCEYTAEYMAQLG